MSCVACKPAWETSKDPVEELDYLIDWSEWLLAGDTITAFTVTAQAGITLGPTPPSATATAVVFWLSGGTMWESYEVTIQVETTGGRVGERTLLVTVCDR